MMREKLPSGTSRNKLRYGAGRRVERIDIRLDPPGRNNRRGAIARILLALIVLGCLAVGMFGLFVPPQVEPATATTPLPSPAVTVQVVSLTTQVLSLATDSISIPAPTAIDLPGNTDAMIELPTPGLAQVIVIPDTEYVNVRAGPGLDYTIIGWLVSGQSAPVTGKSKNGQWWQIQFEDQRGWLFAALVTFSGDPAVIGVVDAQ